jgi:hypothetical protein
MVVGLLRLLGVSRTIKDVALSQLAGRRKTWPLCSWENISDVQGKEDKEGSLVGASYNRYMVGMV